MKIIFKNFWKIDCNFFTLIHVYLLVAEYPSNDKSISKFRAEFGLLGFCLIIQL